MWPPPSQETETSVTFPGLPARVASARRLVRGVLAGSPRADDVVLIVSELAANANAP